jgi:phenylacetate-CoA ligase
MFKKWAVALLLKATGSDFEKQWNEIKQIHTPNDLSITQETYIKALLSHAYHNVPYYSKIFKENNAITSNELKINEFNKIPLLTKTILRKQREAIAANDYNTRKWYYTSSGGSTGEPVRFIQDQLLKKWVNATLRYYYEVIVGIDESGVKKALLWGSEREIFAGTIGLKAKTINWLLNAKLLNSFRMTQADMANYVKIINSQKPDLIRGYSSSLYELCNFIEKNNVPVHQPKVIISAAEMLRSDVRQKIERVFQAKVYDFYGSREAPAIAGECSNGLMHVFMFQHYLEVLDAHNMPVKQGETGKIVITQLHNYPMPLIRYEIGDLAMLGPEKCACGNPLPTLSKIVGRITDNFIKEDGTIIHGEYFTHLFYLKDWLTTFQVVQEDYKKIRVIIVLQNGINMLDKNDIETKIKLVMGQDCTVIWEFVEEIPKTQSGKYLYTKSLLHST